MSQPESNKRRKVEQTFDWKLVLPTPQTFKTLLNIVEPTVSNVTFQVCKEEGSSEDGKPFSGIRIDAINSSKVCLIKVAYECDVTFSSELRNQWFCIDITLLKKLLKKVHASDVIELTRYTDGVDVEVRIYDRDDRNNWSVSTIQLVEDPSQCSNFDMVNMTFNHVVEIDLDRLKETCDLVDKIGSNVIEFCIEEPEEQPENAHHNFFMVQAKGEGCTTQKVHHTVSISDDANIPHMRVVTNQGSDLNYDDSPMVQKYRGVFPIVYLNGVLKSMDRQSIQLYFGTDLPLVMSYGLGGDSSYIKIILAVRES
jgi:hypothetical protein